MGSSNRTRGDLKPHPRTTGAEGEHLDRYIHRHDKYMLPICHPCVSASLFNKRRSRTWFSTSGFRAAFFGQPKSSRCRQAAGGIRRATYRFADGCRCRQRREVSLDERHLPYGDVAVGLEHVEIRSAGEPGGVEVDVVRAGGLDAVNEYLYLTAQQVVHGESDLLRRF